MDKSINVMKKKWYFYKNMTYLSGGRSCPRPCRGPSGSTVSRHLRGGCRGSLRCRHCCRC